jgi:hypothetical protein
LLIQDFARELSEALRARKDSYMTKLVKAPTDRVAGHIEGLDDAIRALESIKRDFLTKSDEDDAE